MDFGRRAIPKCEDVHFRILDEEHLLAQAL